MRLEGKVRDLVVVYPEVWVMTGPLYEQPMPALPEADEAHTVPSGYWKIIVTEDPGTLRVAAFIFPQGTARDADILAYLVTVDDVEARSGLDFLWELPDLEENQIESVTQDAWVQQHFD